MTETNISIARVPQVTVIDPRIPEKAKLRVAAYARVSSDSEDQVNSYIAQVDFYTKHIAGKEDWEMVDIYADEGISGLEARNRDDFNRMMADCREGKIDRVLCKSISRFARNTQEYIQFVRELLRLGISIHFEKENIDTGKMTSEQVAQIYGAFAQMESTNHSSNMRFSVRIRLPKAAPASTDALRIENELALCFNRADINPEYMKTLIMAAAAERYAGLNDPTPAHRRALLRQKLELEPENEETLWELFESAVTHVCIGKGGEISLSQKDQKECAS